MKEQMKASPSFSRYICMLSSSALYMFFSTGIFSSIFSLISRLLSGTSSADTRIHVPSFLQAQICAFGLSLSC